VKTIAPNRQRCAIYTRNSTEHNLDLAFNSLDAQREACEAYIKSQAHEGWGLVRDRFDDGGLSGASLDRPALQDLLNMVRARQVDIVVVYKVDRLTRSLADFAKLVELFGQHDVSFVSVTQSFNTTSSIGRTSLTDQRRRHRAGFTEVSSLSSPKLFRPTRASSPLEAASGFGRALR
jgi:site-specific DNA recombinase